ncbi:MAG: hypothetical protein U9R49_06770 [Bacteroidota bacterium]|nr:hypothetical protein [Bacteroidota bacterium]
MNNIFVRSIYFIAFFVVFFVLVNVAYMTVIAKTDSDFKKRVESSQFNGLDLDLVVFGASTVLDGVDTELLTSRGIKSYNFAIGGASIRTNIIQLEEYLKTCSVKPESLILGLNSSMVDTFDDEEIQPIVEVTMEDHKYSLNDVPILKFKWLGFEFLKKLMSKTHREAILSYGQVKFEKTVTDYTSYVEQYLDIQRFENSFWIGEMIIVCREHDIELILIEMPGYRMTQNLSPAGLHVIMHSNGHQAKLYNYNSRDFCSIFDSEKDWIGNSHLNVRGAEKFTEVLLTVLQESNQESN